MNWLLRLFWFLSAAALTVNSGILPEGETAAEKFAYAVNSNFEGTQEEPIIGESNSYSVQYNPNISDEEQMTQESNSYAVQPSYSSQHSSQWANQRPSSRLQQDYGNPQESARVQNTPQNFESTVNKPSFNQQPVINRKITNPANVGSNIYASAQPSYRTQSEQYAPNSRILTQNQPISSNQDDSRHQSQYSSNQFHQIQNAASLMQDVNKQLDRKQNTELSATVQNKFIQEEQLRKEEAVVEDSQQNNYGYPSIDFMDTKSKTAKKIPLVLITIQKNKNIQSNDKSKSNAGQQDFGKNGEDYPSQITYSKGPVQDYQINYDQGQVLTNQPQSSSQSQIAGQRQVASETLRGIGSQDAGSLQEQYRYPQVSGSKSESSEWRPVDKYGGQVPDDIAAKYNPSAVGTTSQLPAANEYAREIKTSLSSSAYSTNQQSGYSSLQNSAANYKPFDSSAVFGTQQTSANSASVNAGVPNLKYGITNNQNYQQATSSRNNAQPDVSSDAGHKSSIADQKETQVSPYSHYNQIQGPLGSQIQSNLKVNIQSSSQPSYNYGSLMSVNSKVSSNSQFTYQQPKPANTYQVDNAGPATSAYGATAGNNNYDRNSNQKTTYDVNTSINIKNNNAQTLQANANEYKKAVDISDDTSAQRPKFNDAVTAFKNHVNNQRAHSTGSGIGNSNSQSMQYPRHENNLYSGNKIQSQTTSATSSAVQFPSSSIQDKISQNYRSGGVFTSDTNQRFNDYTGSNKDARTNSNSQISQNNEYARFPKEEQRVIPSSNNYNPIQYTGQARAMQPLQAHLGNSDYVYNQRGHNTELKDQRQQLNNNAQRTNDAFNNEYSTNRQTNYGTSTESKQSHRDERQNKVSEFVTGGKQATYANYGAQVSQERNSLRSVSQPNIPTSNFGATQAQSNQAYRPQQQQYINNYESINSQNRGTINDYGLVTKNQNPNYVSSELQSSFTGSKAEGKGFENNAAGKNVESQTYGNSPNANFHSNQGSYTGNLNTEKTLQDERKVQKVDSSYSDKSIKQTVEASETHKQSLTSYKAKDDLAEKASAPEALLLVLVSAKRSVIDERLKGGDDEIDDGYESSPEELVELLSQESNAKMLLDSFHEATNGAYRVQEEIQDSDYQADLPRNSNDDRY